MAEPKSSESFSLDKRVPLAFIMALVVQLVAGVSWVNHAYSALEQRVALIEAEFRAQHERDDRQDKNGSERDDRIERLTAESLALIRADLKEVKDILARRYK